MEFNPTIGIIIVLIIGLLAYYFMFSKEPSAPVSKAATVLQSTPAATVTAPVQVVAKKVSPLDKFKLDENMDRGGADIGCYTDGSSAEFCAEKCLADPTCKAVNYVKPGFGWGAKSGCCYKRESTPLGPGQGISFYTRI